MDKQKETAFREEKKGENLSRFDQLFFNFGAVFPPDQIGAPIVFGSSVELSFGYRFKYKVNGVYSLGWEADLGWIDYKLKQSKEKYFPDTTINKVERFDVSSLGITFFNRFNFDPGRGNTIGRYVEIALRARYSYYELMRKNDLPDGSHLKSINSRLPYTLPLQTVASVRLGSGHFALYANYRLSEIFRARFNYPSLPALTAGIEVGLY